MFVFDIDPSLSKREFYLKLSDLLTHLIDGDRNWVTNYSNASALLFQAMHSLKWFQEHRINWAGFYLVDPKNPSCLYLGPFQGKVACTRIKFGRGVCGAAAKTEETQVVVNVHDFPGHIACDSASNSEIVVPIKLNEQLIGVLDIDSETVGSFDDDDRAGLEAFVSVLANGSNSPL